MTRSGQWRRAALAATAVMALTSLGRAQDQYPPGLMFSTLLNGVGLDKDALKMEQIQAVFLPKPAGPTKSVYPYNPDDGGKLHTVIRKKDGTQLDRAAWFAENLKTVYWLMNSYKLDSGELQAKLAGEGEYVLDFYLNGELFYRYPFKLVSVGSTDAFDPEKSWHLEGAWNDWGYLFYGDADPSQTPMFKLWLMRPGKLSNKDFMVKASIVRESDGAVVCRNTYLQTTPKPWWIRYELQMVDPENEQIFRTERLLKEDGNYAVKVTVDGELYGTYPFAVKDGKIVSADRAQRGKTSPLIFVEGGRDAFWMRRKEAPPEDLGWLLENPPKTLAGAGGPAGAAGAALGDTPAGQAAGEIEKAAKDVEKGLKDIKGLGGKLKGIGRK